MEGREAQRSYSDALASAQARSLFEGVHESLALEQGSDTPLLTRVTVVFDGERSEGEVIRGIVSLSRGGSSLSNDETIAMLAGGMTFISLRGMVITQDGEGEDDPA